MSALVDSPIDPSMRPRSSTMNNNFNYINSKEESSLLVTESFKPTNTSSTKNSMPPPRPERPKRQESVPNMDPTPKRKETDRPASTVVPATAREPSTTAEPTSTANDKKEGLGSESSEVENHKGKEKCVVSDSQIVNKCVICSLLIILLSQLTHSV